MGVEAEIPEVVRCCRVHLLSSLCVPHSEEPADTHPEDAQEVMRPPDGDPTSE